MMTNNAADMQAYYTNAKVAELRDAFARVDNKANWKRGINVVLPLLTEAERVVISEAVMFFTGSVPTFTDIGINQVVARSLVKTTFTRVEAAGYYATIGA